MQAKTDKNMSDDKKDLNWKVVTWVFGGVAFIISLLMNVVGFFSENMLDNVVTSINRLNNSIEKIDNSINTLNSSMKVQEIKNEQYEEGIRNNSQRITENEKNINILNNRRR